MEIQEQQQGAVSVLKPVGPLAGADAEQFQARALEVAKEKLGRLVVDASGIPYMDSAGIESLLAVTETLGEAGRALKLCGVTTTVREVLDLVGWGEAFEYFEDVTAGARSFL